MDKWKSYMDTSGPSSLQWLDDGPLSNPALFGGFWVPWRDEEGLPYATYSALSSSSVMGDIGSLNNMDKGEGDGSGQNTWKLTPEQKEQLKQEHAELGSKTTRVELAAESSVNAGGVAHPYLLLGSGAVLGAVATVAVVTRLNNKRNTNVKLSPV